MYYQSIRKRGSRSDGGGFTELVKTLVWQTAQIVPGQHPAVLRKDVCGAWIRWDKYGDTTPLGYGWEIDHICPVSQGGTDDLSNLQPLQWQNNRAKGDGQLVCAVRR